MGHKGARTARATVVDSGAITMTTKELWSILLFSLVVALVIILLIPWFFRPLCWIMGSYEHYSNWVMG